jgi:hypothetical protein
MNYDDSRDDDDALAVPGVREIGFETAADDADEYILNDIGLALRIRSAMK